jgi:hypothetical protein
MNYKIDIITRTFFGHKEILENNLIQTLKLFTDKDKYHFGVVLDNESEKDHELGKYLLENKLVDYVKYEDLPENHINMFTGAAFRTSPGYDRQQWSTFYLDKYTESDIIGVVDSDSTFRTYLTPEIIFNNEGKIKIPCMKPTLNMQPWYNGTRPYIGSFYQNDSPTLKFETVVDVMPTNNMPFFFHRSTFKNLRDYIEKTWNMSFDEAFNHFSKAPFCQFNILANYAYKFESDKYEFIEQNNQNVSLVVSAINGCHNTRDIIIGGILSYNILENELPTNWEQLIRGREDDFYYSGVKLKNFNEMINDIAHTNSFANTRLLYMINNNNETQRKFVEEHYENVRKEILKLSDERQNELKTNFLNFIKNGINKVAIK